MNHNSKIKVIIILIIISGLFSCGRDGSVIISSDADYIIPLNIGNRWIGTLTAYPIYGNSDSSWSQNYELYIDSMIVNEIGLFYTLNTNSFDIGIVDRLDTLAYGINGIYSATSNEYPPIFFALSLIFKYPANDGEIMDDVCVLSTKEKVVVPAGSFECYCYRFWNFNIYLAPNVGFVKWEHPSYGHYKRQVWELEKVKIYETAYQVVNNFHFSDFSNY